VYIPKENDAETLHASGIEVICISTLSEAAEAMLLRAGAAEAPSAVIGLPVSAAAQGENIAPAITTAANVSHNA
jgi:hypothetical protein